MSHRMIVRSDYPSTPDREVVEVHDWQSIDERWALVTYAWPDDPRRTTTAHVLTDQLIAEETP